MYKMYNSFKPKRQEYTVHQLHRLFRKGFIAVIDWNEYRVVEFLYPKPKITILFEGLCEVFDSAIVATEAAIQALAEWFRVSTETKLEKKIRIKTRFFKKTKFVRAGV